MNIPLVTQLKGGLAPRLAPGLAPGLAPVSYESLRGRRLRDAPHLHPRALFLLPARTVRAVSGAAAQGCGQPHGGQDERHQEEDGHQADGQQEVRGQAPRGQLEGENTRVTQPEC